MPFSTVNNQGSVAVIIVNWNGGELVTRCLRGIRRQTLNPTKIFVVDNASSDGSCETIAAGFPEVTLIPVGENIGFAAANNLAARRAEDCDWIALLNPDAFPEPTWLEQLIAAARDHPEFTFFSSRMLMADDPTRLDGVGDAYHVSGLVWREGHGSPAPGNFLDEREIFSPCAAAALYRRSMFLEAGGFDEDYFCYMEDVDLGFRLRLRGHRCLYVPDAVILHKGSALTGRRSDFSIYYGHRNLVWTYVKNFPGVWFWLYLPLHILLNMLTPFAFLRGGFGTACKAKIDAMRGLPQAWRKRQEIQAHARVGFGYLRPLMAKGLRPIFARHIR
jgi:GT2 family glycosyltransferase